MLVLGTHLSIPYTEKCAVEVDRTRKMKGSSQALGARTRAPTTAGSHSLCLVPVYGVVETTHPQV